MKGRMCLADSAQGLKRKSPDACCFTGALLSLACGRIWPPSEAAWVDGPTVSC